MKREQSCISIKGGDPESERMVATIFFDPLTESNSSKLDLFTPIFRI